MNMQVSKEHSRISPRQVGVITVSADEVKQYAQLKGIGINIRTRDLQDMIDGLVPTMDSIDVAPLAPLGTMSITTPVQFLQTWLPGFVRIISAARKIDTLIGVATVGNWDDEEIVQGVMEPVGYAELYSDSGNIPLSSYNTAFERRTVLRFEKGINVGILEETRAARMRVAVANEKRISATLALEISRNRIGFYGFSSGSNRTFGFLNDPSLPAYATVVPGASTSTLWSTKTFIEITADIRVMAATLQANTLDTVPIDEKTPITFVVPTSLKQFLTITNVQGTLSVAGWIKQTYPNWRVESCPEFQLANGGANVAYLYAEQVDDGATDDSRTFVQAVPAKFMTLGVEKRSKNYLEDYSNATAGCLCKRPYALVRVTGI